jgi:N-acetylmuramoyl-L-alanine amidase
VTKSASNGTFFFRFCYTESMPLYTKIVLVIVGLTLLGGGLFFVTSKKKAQTVFESSPAKELSEEMTQNAEVKNTEETKSIQGETKEEIVKEVQKAEENPEEKEATKFVEKEEVSPKDNAEPEPKNFAIKNSLVSFGHESASGRKIDTVVLHSSYNPSGDPYSVSTVKSIWQSYGVAPHYMVARDGTVYRLVADKDIAYHAGESTMKDGRKNVNDFSIGVEILNTKDDEYTKAQYQAVKDLIAYLKDNHSIKSVVGHDDIAPGRKTDPWNFDWNKI